MTNGAKNIQQEIRNHLIKIKEEFDNHLSGKEEIFLLKLALRTSERKEKFQKILTWIKNEIKGDETLDERDSLERYKILYNNWNEKEKDKDKEYDGSLDFGGRLLTLKNLLETKPPGGGLTESEKNILKQLPPIILSVSYYLSSSNNRHLERAEKFLVEFNKNDLSLKANPNLNEGVTRGQSNPERLADSLKQAIEVCKKMDEEKPPRG